MNDKIEVKNISTTHSNRTNFFGVIWYVISMLFPAISSFLIFSLASRTLIPAELGSVALATTIVAMLTLLCAAGFGDALIQYKNLEKRHLSTVLFLTIITSFSLYIISLAIVETVNVHAFDSVFRMVYPVLGIKLLLDSCSVLPMSMLTRSMSFKAIGIRTIYCSIGAFVVCIPILYLGGGIWAIVFSQVVSSVISFTVLWLSSRIKPDMRFSKQAFDDLKKFGFTTTLSRMVTSISVDNFVIGFVANAATLGVYAFSRRIFSVISDLLNSALSNVSYPIYAAAQDDKVQLRKIYKTTTFISILVSLPSFTGLMLISPYLIPYVFGEQWRVAIPAVQYCCAIGFISCIGALQMSLIKGLGRTSWILKYQFFQQGLTMILAFVFAKYGAEAVIAAIAIKTYLTWPYTVWYISRILDIGVVEYLKNFYKPVIAVMIMAASFIFSAKLLDMNNILYIGLEIVICIVVYCAMILLIARKRLFEMLSLIKKK
ncbi:oligosaccharide flippase family protein [Erwinia billingiae]|uniref:oligosaccharide flippase family protein n=1 Tax=Erwinia billingiae TaxID=182337 RepID=UPI000D00B9B4|nr:oligosaccharide flippase family protein [Erwinia billingiae]PRB58155.1 hypothetical protein CQ001_16615 [Erwinia billingiae]